MKNVYAIHYSCVYGLIMCLWAYDNFVASLLLKDDSLKANHSKTSVSLLSLINPMVYLLSTTYTYACFTF